MAWNANDSGGAHMSRGPFMGVAVSPYFFFRLPLETNETACF